MALSSRLNYREWLDRNRAKIEEYKLMWKAFWRSPLAVVGFLMVIFFLTIGALGPVFLTFLQAISNALGLGLDLNPFELDFNDYMLPPEPRHPMGTDNYGRDLLSRILLGANVSLTVSIIVIILGVPLGIFLGLISGYYGGAIDEIIMRVTDVFLVFPALILAMAISASLGAGLYSAIIAITVVWWPTYVRVVRGQVLSAKENLYVEAAKAIGLSDIKIMFKHILPNILSPIVVLVTMDMGSIVLLNAGLSFIGLGAQPPTPEWGRLVYDGLPYFPEKWWLTIFPGTAVFLTAMGFNLLGDGLNDILDPRYRRRLEFREKEVAEVERKGDTEG